MGPALNDCLPIPPLTSSASHNRRHIDAVELCFHSFIEDIERTRPRYPEEEHDESSDDEPTPRPSGEKAVHF